MISKSISDGITEYQLDLSSVANGSYFLQVDSNEGSYAEKLVVIK